MTMIMTMVAFQLQEQAMQTIKASDFKARCLKLMDEIQKSGDEIIITKNGKPVSKLVPYRAKAATLFGLHEGKIHSAGDDLFSTSETWESDR